jgi:hypothetical protein
MQQLYHFEPPNGSEIPTKMWSKIVDKTSFNGTFNNGMNIPQIKIILRAIPRSTSRNDWKKIATVEDLSPELKLAAVSNLQRSQPVINAILYLSVVDIPTWTRNEFMDFFRESDSHLRFEINGNQMDVLTNTTPECISAFRKATATLANLKKWQVVNKTSAGRRQKKPALGSKRRRKFAFSFAEQSQREEDLLDRL